MLADKKRLVIIFKNRIFRLTVVFLLLLIFFLIPAPTPAEATVYQPGYTLNPDCAPNSANCGITPLATAGINTSITSLIGLNSIGIGTSNPAVPLDLVGNMRIAGNVMPEMTGASGNISIRTLGDTNNRFGDIWTEELHLGASSLYVNGKKVISDISDVMNFTTDIDQSLVLKTAGTGNLNLNTDQGTLFINSNNQISATGKSGVSLIVPSNNPSQNLNLTNTSLNGNITLTATGANSQILENAVQKISLTAPLIELNGVTNLGTTSVTGLISAINLSGTNTGDETLTSIKTKLNQAGTSTDGWLSVTDWNSFNNKLSSYSETDPIFSSSSWFSTANNSSNWNTAYGWGNHTDAGYLTSASFNGELPIIYNSGTGTIGFTNPGYLLNSNNLNDLSSSATARNNLGLGTAAIYSFDDFLASSTAYQIPLVSGTNIKTINSSSILGSGDLVIGGNSTATTTINGAPGPNFTFATSSDINLNFSIATTTGQLTFTPSWIGTLANNRIASSSFWKGYTDFSNTATGLTYNNITGETTLAVDYSIFKTASGTNWNSFYNTPSTIITAGTNLSWSGNTLNATGGSGGGGLSTTTPFTSGYIPYATSTLNLTNSPIFILGTNVGIGTTNPAVKLDISGGNINLNTNGDNILFSSYKSPYNGTMGQNIWIGGGGQYSGALSMEGYEDGGSNNLSLGFLALEMITNGQFNVAIGSNALRHTTGAPYNAGGNYNMGIGSMSLFYNTIGNSNIGIGINALAYNVVGNNNIAIGYDAGSNVEYTNVSDSIFIGASTLPSGNSQSNQIVIGYSAVGLGSNSVVLGNDNITKTRLKGNVGIRMTADNDANYALQLPNNAAQKAKANAWDTYASSIKWKKDVEEIPNALGKIMGIRGINYTWNKGDAMDGFKGTGITAEDLDTLGIYGVTVKNENGEYDSINLTPVIALLVEGIKEQQGQIAQISQARAVNGISFETLNDLVLSGGLAVGGVVDFGRDSIGQAKILAGDTKVQITFTNKYKFQPIVTLTPRKFIDGNYRVATTTEQGFVIEISRPQAEEVIFNWQAFGAKDGKIFSSDTAVSDIELITVPEIPAQISAETQAMETPLIEASTGTTTIPTETPTPIIETSTEITTTETPATNTQAGVPAETPTTTVTPTE